MVAGSGVVMLPAAGGCSADGTAGGSPPGTVGGSMTGTLLGGGTGQAQVHAGVPVFCQAETSVGAVVEGIDSAAGGLATGDGSSGEGVIGATGAEAAFGVIAGAGGVAADGASGGSCGTMLVGFRICWLSTVGVPCAAPASAGRECRMWQASTRAAGPPNASPSRAAPPHNRFNPIRWPRPCDAIMGFAILFLWGKN